MLCREYGISRKTGYKWKERFLQQGVEGLADQSRRPRTSAHRLDETATCRIVRLKLAHPSWGPRKIRTVFGRTDPTAELPSETTFKRVLDRVGLVQHRKPRKQQATGRIQNPIQAERPNQVWTVDFKGWWRTRDRSRFEPLTVCDAHSRYILAARALDDASSDTVRREFERLFTLYGLPEVIRSDNGSPFAASQAPLGLSRLSAWWLTLGINLDRIMPGRPDQNGRHERMHRDIACEVECDPAQDLLAQQAALDVWRDAFNHQRPHEAIGMKLPADVYQHSQRRYEPAPAMLQYPTGYLRRRVVTRGNISLHRVPIRISSSLAGWDVGLQPSKANRYGLWFCRLRMGEVDLETQKFYAATETI